jgi:hypothetical protein
MPEKKRRRCHHPLAAEVLETRTLMNAAPVLVQDGFESGQPSAAWSDWRGSDDNVSVVQGVAHTGDCSYKIHYGRNEAGGYLGLTNPISDEIYVRYWEMLPNGSDLRNLKHAAQEQSGKIGLRAGYHKIRMEFFELSGEEILQASIEGPGLSKRRIEDRMLFA